MKPLDGIVVVETAEYLSGPIAGMMLADLGAEVIKVEPPKGDTYRHFRGAKLSPNFLACNRGKRSVRLDLKSSEGKDALLELVDGADVFLTNWRPDVGERLGLGDAVLAERNPNLVRLWITGWGTDGPRADMPAFDAVAQAQSGLIDASSRDGVLELVPGYPIDKATGMFAVQAILAALLARTRTGAGERIDLAMLDAISYASFPDLMTERVVVDNEPEDPHSPSATLVRAFPASDGSFVIAPVSGKQIKGACVAVGHPEWAEQVFADPQKTMAVLQELLTPLTEKEPRDVWLERFSANDVPVGVCLTIDEHLADEQVLHNDIYAIEDWPGVGRVRTVRYPARGASWGRLSSGPAPV
jgi:crotonobetainyl-CoA:carnitine CoA-transferase CaiB-like acyl-CoA transferase